MHGGLLEEQHPGAGAGGLEGGAAAGDPEADDDHVEALGVGREVARGQHGGNRQTGGEVAVGTRHRINLEHVLPID